MSLVILYLGYWQKNLNSESLRALEPPFGFPPPTRHRHLSAKISKATSNATTSMVRCPEKFQQTVGRSRSPSKNWNSSCMHLFPGSTKHIQCFPNIVICISAREDTRKLWLVGFVNCVQAFLFHPGITEDEVHLGTAHLSIQQLTILPGPGRWEKIDRMRTGWGGWFLEPINSTTTVTNTGKFTSNKPLQLASCFFFGKKKNLVNSSTRKDWFIPFISLFPCLGPLEPKISQLSRFSNPNPTQLPKSSHNFMKPFPSNSALPAPPFHPTKLEAWIQTSPKFYQPKCYDVTMGFFLWGGNSENKNIQI